MWRFLATAALTLTVIPAFGADLGLPTKAPPYAPVTWSGCYIGANAGGGWADKEFRDPLTAPPTNLLYHTANGGVGGGQIGCDVQFGRFVFGLQGMLDAASLRGSHVPADDVFATRASWFATATARGGITVTPHLLAYVKGGAAWMRDRHTITDIATGLLEAEANVTRTGWTVGVGAEYLIAAGWSIFAEYNYMGFGTRRVTFTAFPEPGDPPPPPFPLDIRQEVSIVTVGANYRFSTGGPLYARY
jgi:outer membrane immunogenic protein